jgi:hypothetical protein
VSLEHLERIEAGIHGLVESQRAVLDILNKLLEEMQRPPSGELREALVKIFDALYHLPDAVANTVIEKQSSW